jgi:phosphoglycerol transferase MdoB-like AlkP superfamily enzyme
LCFEAVECVKEIELLPSMSKRKFLPSILVQFVFIYVTALAFFTFFRMVLFFTEISRIDGSVKFTDIFLSFFMGIRFDIIISGYILIFPFIALSISSFFNRDHKLLRRIILYFICILFSIAFTVCAIDIPYFNQFFSRLSVTAFAWFDSPSFVFKMIIEEPRYWWISIPLIICIILFVKIIKRILSPTVHHPEENIYLKIALLLIMLVMIAIGIRGRLDEKSPMRIGTAYFSNNGFLNQLGLNPNFTLIRSFIDSQNDENKSIRLIDDKIAITNVQKYLGIQNPDKTYPLMRNIRFDSVNPIKYNVVLILMESMSAAKMARHGNTDHMTPFLDTLANKGYYFENTYSAGIHTKNGIFGTYFSFPALSRQDPMKESGMFKYHGIFSTLKDRGYSTIYFTTHDGQFDNVEGFLKENDCETVITKADYPADKVKSTLGVPDDYMFEFSIPIINKLSCNNKPFFATFLTASDHGPYYIPDYFKPANFETKKQIVEYADYSLKKFVEMSSKQSWFNNTIFVFIADHGAPMNGLYDMPIDYNHVPLIFYAPGIFKEHGVSSNMAGQIDVFPTIMGLLKLNYTNNTLGIDLFRESRPYIFFNADDKYGVIDKDWFLIVREDKTTSLYKYRNSDTYNYAGDCSNIVDKMNDYAISNLQAFQYIISSNKQ